MKYLWLLLQKCWVLLLTGTIVTIVAAQSAECPEIVRAALDYTDRVCSATERNQACYGNLQLTAVPQANAVNFQFEEPGDIANLAEIQSLNLSTMTDPDEWGVALMKVQADLPDTLPGQNVVMLLFGEVAVQSDLTDVVVTIEVTATNNINIRSGPGTGYRTIGSLTSGETVMADGRNGAGDWYRIQRADGSSGWVFSDLVSTVGNPDALSVVEESFAENSVTYGPMQVFYFTSGVGEAACAEAPQDGILIQTPLNALEVTLNINEVTITLGSTLYLRAHPGDKMIVNVVSGAASLEAAGKTVFATGGTEVSIPLDANGVAAGVPSDPQPANQEDLKALPLTLLDHRETRAESLTADEIAVVATGIPTSGNWEIDFLETGGECALFGFNFVFRDYVKELTLINNDAQLRCNTCDYNYEMTIPGFHVVEIDVPARGGGRYYYREALHLTSPTTLFGTRQHRVVRDNQECIVTSSFSGKLQP